MRNIFRERPDVVALRMEEKPGGPYVRFAIAVIKEFGKTISNDAVEAALKKVRSLRRRNVL